MRASFFGLFLFVSTASISYADEPGRWSKEKANAWYHKTGWLVGCNFIPSTASNQLEMWQAETFDPETIDRELGWAESLGFNSVRVFLHDLLWKQDSCGFLARLDRFLEIAERHHIGVVFAPLDAVWDPHPVIGHQPAPRPHVHNSRWVQAPGQAILSDPSRHDELESYMKGLLDHYKNDPRIHAWDLFNEPGNKVPQYKPTPKKEEMSLLLLKKLFLWAREIKPSQPLTAGVWTGEWTEKKLTPLARYQLDASDVISFHSYGKLDEMKKCVAMLQRFDRPLICTEYMARGNGSTFDPILGYLRAQNVGAYNWGLVDGKTQTIYPWDSWEKKYPGGPPVWFHEIFHTDGRPYRAEEVEYIRKQTGRQERD